MFKPVFHLWLSFQLAWGSAPAKQPEERLKKILGNSTYSELIAYRQLWTAVKSQTTWLQTLQTARQLSPKMSAPLNQMHQEVWNNPQAKQLDFSWVEPFMPGMKVRLVAEGTELVMALNYQDFAELAKRTPEKSDDQLMGLLIKAKGEFSTNWPLWFAQTWDYGGCTHLGSGLHMQIWQDIQLLMSSSPSFAPELNELRSDLLGDLTQVNSFCRPQIQVLKEFNQFLNTSGLNAEERTSIKSRMETVRSGKNVEFNCLHEKANCHFGA